MGERETKDGVSAGNSTGEAVASPGTSGEFMKPMTWSVGRGKEVEGEARVDSGWGEVDTLVQPEQAARNLGQQPWASAGVSG